MKYGILLILSNPLNEERTDDKCAEKKVTIADVVSKANYINKCPSKVNENVISWGRLISLKYEQGVSTPCPEIVS